MKSTLLTLSLCFISVVLNAQIFFVLNNGEKIDCKKYKIKGRDKLIEIKKPKPTNISIEDINFVVTKNGDIRYIRIAAEDLELFSPEYTLMEKIIEGRISILNYSKTYTNGNSQYGHNSNTVTYYFMEKDNQFKRIFDSAILGNRKYNIERFSKYFHDDSEVLCILKSDNFKASTKNMLDLIKKYNVNAFNKEIKKEVAEQCGAILFRGYSTQAHNLVAEVEFGGQKFSLANENYQRIKLLDGKPMKICVSNTKTNMCDLLVGSKHLVKYIEVKLKLNGDIEFEIRNKYQYQKFRNDLNAQK